jgi:hypothetical protein
MTYVAFRKKKLRKLSDYYLLYDSMQVSGRPFRAVMSQNPYSASANGHFWCRCVVLDLIHAAFRKSEVELRDSSYETDNRAFLLHPFKPVILCTLSPLLHS